MKVGQFTDGQTLTGFKTLLSHEKPIQVIYDRSTMTKAVLQCLRSALETCSESGKVVGISGSQEFSMLKGVASLKKYIPDPAKLPEVLKKMRCDQWRWAMSWAVFGLLIHYLEKNLLAKQVVPISDYSFYDPAKSEQGSAKMQIDAQAV